MIAVLMLLCIFLAIALSLAALLLQDEIESCSAWYLPHTERHDD